MRAARQTPPARALLTTSIALVSMVYLAACGGVAPQDASPTTPTTPSSDPSGKTPGSGPSGGPGWLPSDATAASVPAAAPDADAEHRSEDDRALQAASPAPAMAPAESKSKADRASRQGASAYVEETVDLGVEGAGYGGGGTARIGGTGAGTGRLAGLSSRRARKLRPASRHHGQPTAVATGAPSNFNTEAYEHEPANDFHHVEDRPLSTFSVDVDTAAYANLRRFLLEGRRPPADAVRIEEMLNYFDYTYPVPKGDSPFSVSTEVGAAPWQPAHRLVRIGLKGRPLDQADTPARNLVFLLDVSGSMMRPDKLPLLKRGMEMLVDNLREQDRVAIVVYAGASGLVLPSTPGNHRSVIRDAIARLQAGGSTNGAAGIELAYRVARDNFVTGGINRVILATDGDFNVGVTSRGALVRMIEKRRQSGTFLTVLGFGRGNLKDSTMEGLADKGNGNYAYIDSEAEARKVLVREVGGTLVTIAKDVKLQVEFNPLVVSSYRLIGYENRRLAARDFNDDSKDAGEIGAGHTVTALYEVVPRATTGGDREVDGLRYQHDRALTEAAKSHELATVKLRYKHPQGRRSQLHAVPIVDRGLSLQDSSGSLRFAAAVAGFGMVLRGSPHRGDVTLAQLASLARGAQGRDPHGERGQLLDLMAAAGRLGLR